MEGNGRTEYKITGKQSLELLMKGIKVNVNRFVVEADSLNELQRRKFENELNKYYSSCGCTTGNYFLVTSLILCLIYVLASGVDISNWKIIIEGFLILFAASVIGKFAGKFADRLKFRKTVVRLNGELK